MTPRTPKGIPNYLSQKSLLRTHLLSTINRPTL